MSGFIPNGDARQKEMLEDAGYAKFDDLLENIPAKFLLKKRLNLPDPATEMELTKEFKVLAGRNSAAGSVSFLGAGSYDHFIPAALDHILLRSEFYTAYTPYQPEVSQGTLQAIFEYQTMITRLTGMEISNASMYDGATAAAEACLMAMRVKRNNRILVAGSINPRWLEVVRTYLTHEEFEIIDVPYKDDGTLDLEIAGNLCEGGVAGLLVAYPNYFGLIENIEPISDLVHSNSGLLIVASDPVVLPLLRSPGDAGADIVVGEGQSMGISMTYGGPYIGFMATRKKLTRKMPGRIIGRTEDRAGQVGYVMTLQTREQHIRRQKATSNICSNEALLALANAVYLSLMGDSGFRDVSSQCFQKSHYLEGKLLDISGVTRVFGNTPFFREFVLEFPVSAVEICERL
ncbi:MAG: aminomethyl-transferring glycine dehydrogenase subunit GcvPA, partial [FCB group bacterium]|nr:aminomethyl-transferring glycine dehydrogenase subunit GcvPA [FCB group bacterium]